MTEHVVEPDWTDFPKPELGSDLKWKNAVTARLQAIEAILRKHFAPAAELPAEPPLNS